MAQKRLRVLICEDEPLTARGIECCLQELGHQTCGIVYTGSEAVAFVEGEQPDLILMDINMPELDGITAMQQISRRYAVPCIFITAYSDQDSIVRSQSSNTYGYLIKPVDVNDLNAAINVAVSRFTEYEQVNNMLSRTKSMLAQRKIIERAKGILMDEFSMKEADAMAYLQQKSRNSNRKLYEISEEIIRIKDRLK